MLSPFTRHSLIATLLLAAPVVGQAQTGGVSIGAPTPDASAALDIVSTSKGMLVPRVTSTASVPSPATGLLVFQTNSPAGFYYNAGSAATPTWEQVATAANVTGAGVTASNGLTKTGQNVALGGTLSGVTTIAQGNNALNFTGGNVGIGAANASGQRLEVAGSVYANGEGTGFLSDVGSVARVGLLKYANRESGIWRLNNQDFEVGRVSNPTTAMTTLPGTPSTFVTDLYVGETGRVGIGLTNPYSQLSNTASNIIGPDNQGGGEASLAWVASQAGYAGQFFNAGTTGASNGLLVKIAGTTGNAFDVSQQAVVGTAGAALLRVTGDGRVGIGTATPNATAALEVNSTTRGFLPPRLTLSERNGISNPATGLLIYQTTDSPGLYQRTAAGWVAVGAAPETKADIAAPSAPTTLNPTTTTVNYTLTAAITANGPVTLGTGTEGQRLVIVNNDNVYLPVTAASGTGNVLPGFAARYQYTAGGWRRES